MTGSIKITGKDYREANQVDQVAFMGAVIRILFDGAGIFSTTELTEHMHYYKLKIYIFGERREGKGKCR